MTRKCISAGNCQCFKLHTAAHAAAAAARTRKEALLALCWLHELISALKPAECVCCTRKLHASNGVENCRTEPCCVTVPTPLTASSPLVQHILEITDWRLQQCHRHYAMLCCHQHHNQCRALGCLLMAWCTRPRTVSGCCPLLPLPSLLAPPSLPQGRPPKRFRKTDDDNVNDLSSFIGRRLSNLKGLTSRVSRSLPRRTSLDGDVASPGLSPKASVDRPITADKLPV
jgi:hypothetical protein